MKRGIEILALRSDRAFDLSISPPRNAARLSQEY
jgi:hypothetical protein